MDLEQLRRCIHMVYQGSLVIYSGGHSCRALNELEGFVRFCALRTILEQCGREQTISGTYIW